ncbi:MAG: PAS domain S-box protein [Methanobacterium sp.]|jgi:PAS domain S-box-containing protein
MKDEDKTKEQLINELENLRQRIAELEKVETRRKKVEKVLKEPEACYNTIFENTGTAMVIIEEDEKISLVNTEFEKLSGYSKEELEGKKSLTEFVVKDDLKKTKEYRPLRRVNSKAASRNYEVQFVDRKGNVRDIFMIVAMISGTRKSLASLLDITEEKRAENQIKTSFLEIIEDLKKKEVLLQGTLQELILQNMFET